MVFAAGVFSAAAAGPRLPPGFVYLRDVAPTIRQDIRYATPLNFTGAVVPGYGAAECILATVVARALKRVQADLRRRGYGLTVFDCYRPARAVRAFVRWVKDSKRSGLKQVFYPRVAKPNLLRLGYIAPRSGHATGSAVDVTLVRLGRHDARPDAVRGRRACGAVPSGRARSVDRPVGRPVDMGTGFDCFDPLSRTASRRVSLDAQRHRRLLVAAMHRHGFRNYPGEWWHYNFVRPPFRRAFDFPILPRARR